MEYVRKKIVGGGVANTTIVLVADDSRGKMGDGKREREDEAERKMIRKKRGVKAGEENKWKWKDGKKGRVKERKGGGKRGRA